MSWADEIVSGREIHLRALNLPSSSVGLVIDVFLLVLPAVAVSSLQMNTTRKIGIMLIFGTGLMSVVFLFLFPWPLGSI